MVLFMHDSSIPTPLWESLSSGTSEYLKLAIDFTNQAPKNKVRPWHAKCWYEFDRTSAIVLFCDPILSATEVTEVPVISMV